MQIENIPEFDEIILSDTIQTQTDDSVETSTEVQETTETQTEEKQYSESADPIAIAAYEKYVEQGIIEPSDEFDGTWENLDKNLSDLPQRVLNSLVAKAPDVARDVVRFAFSSPNITKEEMLNFIKTDLSEQEELPAIDTMDDARSFLEQTYKDRGMKPRAIEAALAALEEDDILMDEAKEEYDKTAESKKAKPKTEALISAKENEILAANEEKTAFTGKIFDELNSIGWKASKIDEIKNRIVKNEINPLLTEIFKSPKALIKMVDFIGYFKNGDIDYDKFINTIETPKGKDIKAKFDEIVNSPTLSTKSNFKNSTTESDNLRPVFD
jgi:hypothetical protein